MSTTTQQRNASSIFGVEGKYQYSIFLDKTPVTLNLEAEKYSIIINQNIRQKVPVIKMKILDYQNLYSFNNPINDGTRIRVALNDGSQGIKNYLKFRSFGTPKRHDHFSGYSELEIYGLLDVSDYLYQTVNRSFNGSSTGVISQIASVLNMKFSTNDNSNDSMKWLPYKKTWAEYVKYIAKHAWTDEKSVFSVAVGEDTTLYFNNIQKLFENRKPVVEFIKGGTYNKNSAITQIEVLTYQGINRSGQMNFQGAYGMRTSQTDGTGKANIYQPVVASKNANSNLDIDRNTALRIKNRSLMQIAPMDCGNSHTNYIRARHQNKRLALTYSQNLYVLTNELTGVNLYDIATGYIAHYGIKDDTTSGIYMVSAISRFIYQDNYFEKIELTNMGPSNKNPEIY